MPLLKLPDHISIQLYKKAYKKTILGDHPLWHVICISFKTMIKNYLLNGTAMDTQNDKSHILVVDDEKCIRVYLKDFLEDEGFVVSTADGLPEAMEILAACDFDVAVIDRVLSKGDSGLDLIKHIAEVKPFCETILITAYPTYESAQVCLKYGSSDGLLKPVARDHIVSSVKAASHKSRQKRHENLPAAQLNSQQTS